MLYTTSLRRGTCASLSRRQCAKSGESNKSTGWVSVTEKKYFCVNICLFKLITFFNVIVMLFVSALFEKVCGKPNS